MLKAFCIKVYMCTFNGDVCLEIGGEQGKKV